MIRSFAPSLRLLLLRSSVVVLLAAVAGTACDNSDPLESTTPSDQPTGAATETPAELVPAFATVSYTGLPFGPIGLWSSNTTVSWGPGMFTGTQNFTDASGVITQINTARLKKQRLILAMTGGPSTRYTTNGKFDMTKWKNKQSTFNTSAIKSAIAAGVADGTVIANQMIDEPETKRWGGNLTKAMIDQMASYAKSMFPSLPMGLNHGPPGYNWRSTEHYKVLDYVLYQYNYYITSGNVATWRDAVLSRARADGVTPMLSINVMDGGIQDRTGTYDCSGSGQAGRGTYFPNCRMTPTQVRTFGTALAAYGCALQMWRYDDVYISKAANQDAFKDVAAVTNSKPRKSCKRP
jgi:hypothetical protein